MPDDTKSSMVFLDRIENNRAVLILGESDEFSIPISLLPEHALEGIWLSMRLTIDPQETEKNLQHIKKLREQLGSGDDKGDLDL